MSAVTAIQKSSQSQNIQKIKTEFPDQRFQVKVVHEPEIPCRGFVPRCPSSIRAGDRTAARGIGPQNNRADQAPSCDVLHGIRRTVCVGASLSIVAFVCLVEHRGSVCARFVVI
ncbi:hypothetical protein K523DRAFT_130888 [Schizophyllum commune Tattone D]|nr:hypothetical protein K523DRAFT_130888 [Schizophyllum commune Tattone D]